MTIKEIKAVLKDLIKDEWVVFEDASDKKYFLDLIKTEDLETVFSELEVSNFTNKNLVEDIREEYESL